MIAMIVMMMMMMMVRETRNSSPELMIERENWMMIAMNDFFC
jgi:hypothetical protein